MFSALIALRIDIIAVSPPRSPKSVKKTIRVRHVYLKQLLCRHVFAKNIANRTRMHILLLSIHFCSGNTNYFALSARAALAISAEKFLLPEQLWRFCLSHGKHNMQFSQTLFEIVRQRINIINHNHSLHQCHANKV